MSYKVEFFWNKKIQKSLYVALSAGQRIVMGKHCYGHLASNGGFDAQNSNQTEAKGNLNSAVKPEAKGRILFTPVGS